MASTILARVSASKSVLDAMRACSRFPEISKSEAVDIVNQLQAGRWQRAELAEVVSAVAGCAFLAADAHAVTECAAECMMSSAPPECTTGLGEGKSQKFEAGVRYVPDAMWQRLSESWDPDEVLSFFVRLGCRKPNEDTTGHLGLMILVVTEGLENAQAMTPTARTNFCNTIKNLLKKKIKGASAPRVLLPSLPRHPAGFKESQPELYEEAFGDSTPSAKLPIPEVTFNALIDSTKWRLHGNKSKPLSRSSSFDNGGSVGPDALQCMGDRIGDFVMKGLAAAMGWNHGRMQDGPLRFGEDLHLTYPAHGQRDVVLRGRMQQQREEQQQQRPRNQLELLSCELDRRRGSAMDHQQPPPQEHQTMGHQHHEEGQAQGHQHHGGGQAQGHQHHGEGQAEGHQHQLQQQQPQGNTAAPAGVPMTVQGAIQAVLSHGKNAKLMDAR